MAKAKKPLVIPYTPPSDPYIYFYVGEKYYKRLFPIPYKHYFIDYKKLKEKVCGLIK